MWQPGWEVLRENEYVYVYGWIPLSSTWNYHNIVKQLWKWKSLSHVWLFVTPWTIQSMEFSRPEYLSMESQTVGHDWATFTHSAILYNRTLLFMHSIQNSLHPLNPNSQAIPLPPLIFVITALDDYLLKLQFPHLYNRLKPHRLFWDLNIIIQLHFHTVHRNYSKCMN